MDRERAESGTHSQAGAEIEALPDGSTRVLLSWRDSPTGLPWVRLEWRLRPGVLEVRSRWPGLTLIRRYDHGSLWLQPQRSRHSTQSALILQTGRRTTTLAVGEKRSVRSLGSLIERHTGWRLRISRQPLRRAVAPVLEPLPLFFLISGLVIAVAGFSQARRAGDQIRLLRPVMGSDLDSMPVGAAVLATGTVSALSNRPHTRLVVFDAQGYRVEGRRGPAWDPMLPDQPPFRLQTRGGSLTVQRQSAVLVAPRHAEWVRDRRYSGFREGDEVTIVGTVVREDRRAILAARMIYGGTRAGLTRRGQQQGLLVAGLGLVAAVIGVLLLRAMRV